MYIAIFEAEILIGDVFAFTLFIGVMDYANSFLFKKHKKVSWSPLLYVEILNILNMEETIHHT